MQSFDNFYTQQVLDEEGIKDAIVDKAKSLASNVFTKAKKVLSGLDFERKETLFMLETFFKQLREILKDQKSITDEDVKRAVKQLGDIGKFSLIAPLFLLPGGGTTTAVLYMAGKKFFNISILPQGLEQVFEMIYDNKYTLNILTEIQENKMKNFSDYINENKRYRDTARSMGFDDAQENYAKNNVSFDFDIRSGYNVSARVKNILGKIVGVVDWKARFARADVAYLAEIDAFDKRELAGVNVKPGEYVFRYATEDTAIAQMAPYIKINIKRGLMYFLTEESSSGEVDYAKFESRGVKVAFLKLSPEWAEKLRVV